MITGCTNPHALNYDPTADTEDYSCKYSYKKNGCHAFTDVPAADITEQSFTLSFGLEKKDWIFFHDYIPDYYIHTRDRLYNLKGKKIYRHNAGAPGVYHDGLPKSFFIDVIFNGEEMTLNTIEWITEILSPTEEEFATLTHITVWTNQQCTGRIVISDVFQDLSYQPRKTQTIWSFSDFRDKLAVRGTPFLTDLFANFAVDPTALSDTLPWYEQNLLENNWFCIRFEYDNISGKQIVLHGVDINASKSYR